MDKNQINNALRQFAFSGRATTADIPYLYGLRDPQGGQGAFEGGAGGGIPNSGGGEIPSQGGGSTGAADTGLPGTGLGGVFGGDLQPFGAARALGGQYDSGGGRGDDGPADTGFSAVGPLSDLDKDILDAIGLAAPGFGAVTGITKAASALGIPGVNTPASFGLPGTEEFARNIEAYRAQQQISRERHAQADGNFGDFSGVAGTDVFGEPGLSDPGDDDLSGGGGGGSAFGGSDGTDTFGGGNPSNDSLGGGGGGRDGGNGGGSSDGGESGGVGCFVAWTPILLADGSLKRISEIEVGDMVASFDGMGELEPKRVAHVMVFEDKRPRVLHTADGARTTVTSEHPFLRPDGSFSKAGEIDDGESIVNADGESVIVFKSTPQTKLHRVYNFEVEDNHTYVANGFRVHNIKHSGGFVSDNDATPGEELTQATLEGEYVMSQEASQMFGKLLPVMNAFARQEYGAAGPGQNHNAISKRMQGY